MHAAVAPNCVGRSLPVPLKGTKHNYTLREMGKIPYFGFLKKNCCCPFRFRWKTIWNPIYEETISRVLDIYSLNSPYLEVPLKEALFYSNRCENSSQKQAYQFNSRAYISNTVIDHNKT